MATPFPRTLRSLSADRHRRSAVSLALGVVLLAGWLVWMFVARVAVYVTSPEARVEIDKVAHPIQAPLSGRVVTVSMELGKEVHAGDVLVELDVEAQRLAVERGRAHLAALGPEIEAAKKQLEAQHQAEDAERAGTGVSVAEAQARFREAAAAARHAAQEVQRTTRLANEGLVSEAEVTRVKSELEQRLAGTEALRLAVGRTAATKRIEVSDRRVQTGALERQIAQLEGELKTVQAEVDGLEHEVARRVLRAPVDGQLAEIVPVTVGAVVKEGDQLGAILPVGHLRAVAELAPHEALGWVRVGQPARLRLEGFPWAQHGTIAASVTRVASEVRDGRVRVELSLDASRSQIPLQHGLPGTVEIEVERTSPIVLTVRSAGKMLDRPRAEAAPPPTASLGAPP